MFLPSHVLVLFAWSSPAIITSPVSRGFYWAWCDSIDPTSSQVDWIDLTITSYFQFTESIIHRIAELFEDGCGSESSCSIWRSINSFLPLDTLSHQPTSLPKKLSPCQETATDSKAAEKSEATNTRAKISRVLKLTLKDSRNQHGARIPSLLILETGGVNWR